MVFKTNIPLNHRNSSPNKKDSEDYIECKSGYCRPKTCRLMGVIFACAGLIFSYLMTVNQFSCHRPENMCLFQERHFWEKDFQTKKKMAMADIKYAYVDKEEHCDDDGCSTSYSVKLKTNYGDRKPFHTSGGYNDAQTKAARINNFLNMELMENLIITDSAWWFLFPWVFVFVGLFLIWIPHHMKKKARKEQNPSPIVER